ncbi:phage tail assembly protein T [Pandoraea bronchicola]|uniref:phage tail assembly protein T n=1 Tax=Pandoraea bronchicola TaxID=2508287 RepID=UPI0012421C0D
MSVARCQAEVSGAEFGEWLAYYQIEPFGTRVDDLRAGVIAAATYNVNRDRKRQPEPFGPSDVIPWLVDDSGRNDEPILLDDPAAQTALIRASLFGSSASGKADDHREPQGAQRLPRPHGDGRQ